MVMHTAGGDDTVAGDDGSTTSSTATTSVVLVTELIRLTLKKLQTALEEQRINDDDLVAMATAVDAGAVSAALRARHGSATAACLRASTSLPVSRRPSDVARSVASRSDAAEFNSPVPSSTDRLIMTGDHDKPDALSSCEIAEVAKKVLSDVMCSLAKLV